MGKSHRKAPANANASANRSNQSAQTAPFATAGSVSIARGNPHHREHPTGEIGGATGKPSQSINSTSPRILISRLSAIGDAILTLPVACSLREAFPDAYLAWVVEKKAAPMVRHHEALDHVIELERGWFASPTGIRQARQVLQQHRIEISIDCQGNTKSAMAGWLSGARRRIGFRGKHSCELSGLLNNEKVTPVFNHITDRSLELLTPLQIHQPKVRWALPMESCDRDWATEYRQSISQQRVAVMNPGGTWASKLWEPDRFASTSRYLADRYGYHSVIVWGTFEERLMAEEIVDLSEDTATLAPDTTLKTLAALIETSDLFLSGDTGPLHMAVAVGARTIGLYGATRPGDCGPYGQVALQLEYESGSRRHRRSADNRAMRAIGVEHVCSVIDEMHMGSGVGNQTVPIRHADSTDDRAHDSDEPLIGAA